MHDAPHADHEHFPDQIRLERFYQRLLSLDAVGDMEPILADALRFLAELSRARLIYLEIVGDDDDAPTIWRGHAANAASVDSFREQISRGIVQRTLTEGRTIETSSAFLDERFAELSSVRHNEIGAVLCTPIGSRIPVGVVYVQGSRAFSAADRRRVDELARRVVRIVPRLTQGKPQAARRPLVDETRELQDSRVREAMERHDENIAEVARELCVGRAFIYRVLRRLAKNVSG